MDRLLLEALDTIDPAELSRQEWIDVGMALKAAGEDVSAWEAWSAKDPARYHPGECSRLWSGFKRSGINGGTVIHMARERGWDGGGHALDWDDEISYDAAPQAFSVEDGSETWIARHMPADWDPLSQIREYLITLFRPGEYVGYVVDVYDHGDRVSPRSGSYTRTRDELLAALEKYGMDTDSSLGAYDRRFGAWIRFNPLDGRGISDENVTDFRYTLIEADGISLEEQFRKVDELRLPVAVMVYSGGKSLHAIVRVDAVNKVEYTRRVREIYDLFTDDNGKPLIDTQNKNASRLSRFPGFERNGQKQFIIPYQARTRSWQEWHDQYLEDQADALPDFGAVSSFVGPYTPALKPELIHGILRQGHKMLLAGSSKAGKSFALMELAIAISTGGDWLGWPCEKGKVLYCNFELDEASARNRFNVICRRRGLDPVTACEGITDWNLRGYNLKAKDFSIRLFSRARQLGFAAVIIDPIYKLGLGDENSAGDVGSFLGVLDTICTTLGCAVIYCHHHSKGAQSGKAVADRASGSGVFARDADAILDLIQLRPTSSAPSWFTDNPKATAWRVSAVLREFEEPAPKNVWFDYPIHREDEDGSLAEARTIDEVYSVKELNDIKDAALEERKQKAFDAFDTLRDAYEDGWVPVTGIRNRAGIDVQDRVIVDYFKVAGFEIQGDLKARKEWQTKVRAPD